MEDEDSDFLECLNTEYTSILDDPKPRFSIDCGDDPSYALFFSSLKNDGSSYYMENDPNGEDENDLDSHAKTEEIGFQSSNVIYQYKNGASVVFDGLIFLNSPIDDNVVSKKRKYTDAIQHETTSKGSKDVKSHCGSPQQTMCSNFRVQILEILRKPYDKKEHERLMQEITKRKPQHRHRDLRSGGKISRSDGQKRISLMTNHSFHGTTKNVFMCSQKDPKWKCKTRRNRYVHSKSRERLGKILPRRQDASNVRLVSANANTVYVH
ncbi:hypothetical protein M9H77_11493 [Catharanthus roseus]|uniref:Uncharacterized protein n=1 Tax=Catharanthus roseus TaxID=4058 RepID=A0ACC0BEQ6_CATRO|nr:hypothetical protein M9H77_11493 [Catharanthus roseus]